MTKLNVAKCKWVAVLSLLLLAAATRADMPKQAQACVACHGPTGAATSPQWPNLGGQSAAYLVDQISQFRDGVRQNAMMMPFVKNLSDKDIQVLADYYASQELKISANGKESMVETGENLAAYCKACHGMEGMPAAKEWPIIAGQNAPYIYQQLMAFKDGKRQHSAMEAVVMSLGKDEFRALAAYYSQKKP